MLDLSQWWLAFLDVGQGVLGWVVFALLILGLAKLVEIHDQAKRRRAWRRARRYGR
jgi:hypothetical protein